MSDVERRAVVRDETVKQLGYRQVADMLEVRKLF